MRHLVSEAGIRRFLDIGTGPPTTDHTHEVARRLAPGSRIVCVDNDPLVLAHARALLTSTPEGRTHCLDEDLRDVDAILEHAAKTLDFGERHLVLTPHHHLPRHAGRGRGRGVLERAARRSRPGGRTPEEVARFLDGPDLLEPGVVSCSRRRPEGPGGALPEEVARFGGVARTP